MVGARAKLNGALRLSEAMLGVDDLLCYFENKFF